MGKEGRPTNALLSAMSFDKPKPSPFATLEPSSPTACSFAWQRSGQLSYETLAELCGMILPHRTEVGVGLGCGVDVDPNENFFCTRHGSELLPTDQRVRKPKNRVGSGGTTVAAGVLREDKLVHSKSGCVMFPPPSKLGKMIKNLGRLFLSSKLQSRTMCVRKRSARSGSSCATQGSLTAVWSNASIFAALFTLKTGR